MAAYSLISLFLVASVGLANVASEYVSYPTVVRNDRYSMRAPRRLTHSLTHSRSLLSIQGSLQVVQVDSRDDRRSLAPRSQIPVPRVHLGLAADDRIDRDDALGLVASWIRSNWCVSVSPSARRSTVVDSIGWLNHQ